MSIFINELYSFSNKLFDAQFFELPAKRIFLFFIYDHSLTFMITINYDDTDTFEAMAFCGIRRSWNTPERHFNIRYQPRIQWNTLGGKLYRC